MISALASGSTGSSVSPGHWVVSLVKTLQFHSASLHPGVSVGSGEFNVGGNSAMD